MKLHQTKVAPPNGWEFYYRNVNNHPARLVAETYDQLTDKIYEAFDREGIPPPENLDEVIQHQMCVRLDGDPEWCNSSQVGDKIHQMAKVALRSIEKTARRIGYQKVASSAKNLAGCSACGGTRVYDPSVDNLGRAGKVNKLFT